MAELLPIVDRQIHADVSGERVDMDRCVGRAADRRIDDNAVFEGFSRQDVGRFEILPHHSDNAGAGLVGNLAALAIGGRDRGAARQRHP